MDRRMRKTKPRRLARTIADEEKNLEYARQQGLESEQPYEEDEGYPDKLEDIEADELEPPEEAEDFEGGWREELREVPARELADEDEGNGNAGARFALERGFASIDEARRREQRGERGD